MQISVAKFQNSDAASLCAATIRGLGRQCVLCAVYAPLLVCVRKRGRDKVLIYPYLYPLTSDL